MWANLKGVLLSSYGLIYEKDLILYGLNDDLASIVKFRYLSGKFLNLSVQMDSQRKGLSAADSGVSQRSHAAAANSRRLTVAVFALFFSWLLAFPFEGRILYALVDYYAVPAQSFVFGAMAAHFVGLIVCGFLVRSMRAAKKLVLFSIVFCAAASGVFFFPPSFLWTAALLAAMFLVGACVAAWGFYFKGCTPKDERIKTIADGLIFSNVLMILLNMAAIHISPQAGLGCSMLALGAAFLFALRLPEEATPEAGEVSSKPKLPLSSAIPSPAQGEIHISVAVPLAFLCLFVVIITINAGLMYQVISPAFTNLEWLTSWYWAVPYIAALFVMRNLPRKTNRAYILYVAIAMFGFAFITFQLIGRSWADYLLVNTLMLGACGVYDLFWWSILGGMLELGKNPARILGVGLSANVLGVLLGKLIGNAIMQTAGQSQNTTLLSMGVVCVTFTLLPPLHQRLTELLKSHIYLTTLAEIPAQEQARLVREFNLNERLSVREGEVVAMIIQGKTYKAIGEALFVSENTIKSHVKSIYSKAGVTSKAELISLLLKPPNSSV